MSWRLRLKTIAATATVIGIVLGFCERVYAPSFLENTDSPDYPAWLGWAGFVIVSVAAAGYVIVDLSGGDSS